jgi:hypothetical protein
VGLDLPARSSGFCGADLTTLAIGGFGGIFLLIPPRDVFALPAVSVCTDVWARLEAQCVTKYSTIRSPHLARFASVRIALRNALNAAAPHLVLERGETFRSIAAGHNARPARAL